MTEKLFMRWWNTGAYIMDGKPDVDTCGIENFCGENGYPDDIITDVNNLKFGETLVTDNENHIITRVQ